jgi:integrase
MKPTRKVSSWTPEEALRFIEAARDHEIYAAFLILAMVGLRKGEVLGMHWADIDFEARMLRIRRQVQRIKGQKGLRLGDPKSDAARRLIHLPQHIVEALLEHQAVQHEKIEHAGSRWIHPEIVFATSRGTYIDPRNFNDFVTDLCIKAKIETVAKWTRTPHSLRHTAGTLARALGVDWKDIQMMLGHSSIKITMDIYVDEVPELQQESATLIGEGFRRASAVRSQLPPQLPPGTDSTLHGRPDDEPPEGGNA